jgi:hypothetical protein
MVVTLLFSIAMVHYTTKVRMYEQRKMDLGSTENPYNILGATLGRSVSMNWMSTLPHVAPEGSVICNPEYSRHAISLPKQTGPEKSALLHPTHVTAPAEMGWQEP